MIVQDQPVNKKVKRLVVTLFAFEGMIDTLGEILFVFRNSLFSSSTCSEKSQM